MRTLLTALCVGSVVAAQHMIVPSTQVARDVKKHLMSLPYYGPFDLLTYSVDSDDVVTLGGYVVLDTIRKDAEREAREVNGVKEVKNKIEVAEAYPLDDEIRHRVFHAIYGDPGLSRYGTPGNELWSMRPAFRGWGRGFGMHNRELLTEPFFGLEPIGDYAIHILVKARAVTLVGVVDSEGDKTIAGIKARSVSDVSVVNNDLEVGTKSSETK
ncbi:MAG TPA: BON domain-containing protein [Vicinamibacterales bacterium]|nr:BON domain-containing protein [Vicinamibacterales bacterium]